MTRTRQRLPAKRQTLVEDLSKKAVFAMLPGRHWLLVALVISLLACTADSSSIASPSFGLQRRTRRSFHTSSCLASRNDFYTTTHVRNAGTSILSRRLHPRGTTNPDSIWYYIKVALAGGIAGAVGSSALYPMDAAKTLRQSCPSEYPSVFHALGKLVCTQTTTGALTWHVHKVYRGVIPAAVGAIPSSALYFGAYESMKALLKQHFPLEGDGGKPPIRGAVVRKNNFPNRLLVHALAAMSGNILSSAVFVPKELIKQQLQFRQSGNVLGVVVDILATKGLGGLYVGYKATLMRNIPTAVLRFSLYEEFRYRWTSNSKGKAAGPKFFLAGAAAGILASGVMTPVDVLKTRLATGTCPVDVKSCFMWIIQEEGINGLYAGVGSRMFFSGAFSAIGFGTFEWAKGVLGVATTKSSKNIASTRQKTKASAKLALKKQQTKTPLSRGLIGSS